MRLKQGDIPPQFITEDIDGNTINLEDYKGKRVLLSFFRYAACPLCNLRVNKMINKYDAWQQNGLEVIAVFESSKTAMVKEVGKQRPPFPLIPDPKKLLYKQYGVVTSWWGFFIGMFRIKTWLETMYKGFFKVKPDASIHMMPAEFLIDENGIIQTAYYGKDMGDHLSFDHIDAFVLNTNVAMA